MPEISIDARREPVEILSKLQSLAHPQQTKKQQNRREKHHLLEPVDLDSVGSSSTLIAFESYSIYKSYATVNCQRVSTLLVSLFSLIRLSFGQVG